MDYINQYLNYKSGHIAYSDRYRVYLKRFIEGAGKPLVQVNNLDVDEFQNKLLMNYKPATVAMASRVVRGFLAYWKRRMPEMDIFPEEIKPPVVPEEYCNYFTEEEMDMMEESYDEDEYYGLQRIVLLKLLRNTAARVSEITTLEIGSIEQLRYAIILRRKARKRTIISWDKITHGLLMKYLAAKMVIFNDSFVFSARGKAITNRTAERWVKEAAERAGITRRVYPHMYRHTKAFSMAAAGKGILAIQQKLGHSNMNSPLKYLRLDPKYHRKVAD